ncbi:MAG TPA: ATP-binding protein [Gemmatimonadaceae bacterium]|nr:ATP-binding protein [Gemmatimonadaceae bacterium]
MTMPAESGVPIERAPAAGPPEADDQVAPSDQQRGSQHDTLESLAAESTPPSILVVDDTPGNRYTVARVLRGAGMRVNEAATGAEALRFAKAQPDLIVLDIRLPDMTGYDVCQRLKGDPETKSIPVMYLSASYTGNADRAYGLDAGADAYLTHPIDPPLFLATAHALLRAGRAESAFRSAAVEWRTTFDAIRDAIFLVDADGIVRRCNRAAGEFAHEHPRALVGRPWSAAIRDLGIDRPDAIADIVRGPILRDIEIGQRGRWLSVSTERIAGRTPEQALTLCVLSDITSRKSAQVEREDLLARTAQALHDAESARREAESANRAKSDFLAVMSHELRTPLNAIAGFTELISLGVRGPVTQDQLNDLERIRRSEMTLLTLINDLLSFAKLESGSVQYAISDMAADEAMEAASEFVELQVRTKGISFVHVPCPASVFVRADPDKVKQILLNLLSNAVKFTDAGGTITLRCSRDANRAYLYVSDTGAGIPADKLEAIFDPFVQVDQRLVREHPGVGLGLAISRDLARGMGGDLTVASTVGEGSVFTLSLPTKP